MSERSVSQLRTKNDTSQNETLGGPRKGTGSDRILYIVDFLHNLYWAAMLALLHPDDNLTSYKLSELIHLLDSVVSDVTTEFHLLDSPLSLLLPCEANRAAADALSASLRLRNQLKYFNAGFPRSLGSRRRLSSSKYVTAQNGSSTPCLHELPSRIRNSLEFNHSRPAVDEIAEITSSKSSSASPFSAKPDSSESIESGNFMDTQTGAVGTSVDDDEMRTPETKTVLRHRHQHYYHYDETFDEMPLGDSDSPTAADISSRSRKSEPMSNSLCTSRTVDSLSEAHGSVNLPPGFYRSLLHRDDRERRARTESILQRERRILCLSLCMPFFTWAERFGKVAKLSTGCHRLAMSESPITEADFCSADSEGLLLLPVRQPLHIHFISMSYSGLFTTYCTSTLQNSSLLTRQLR